MEDQIYSLREENTFRNALFNRMDTQDNTLGRIEADGKETRIQTTKHNGRMTVIETRLENYEDYVKSIDYLKGWKMWIVGGVSVIIVGGGFVWNLVLENITNKNQINTQTIIDKSKEEIGIKVVSILEEKYKLNIK